jgi:tripartite-type tricarboxylate transporter receptor subunit TctC
MSNLLRRGLSIFVLCGIAVCAYAQSWPVKPIRLVVPYPPGSSSVDIIGRIVASKLGEGLGQPVLVENRAGASGAIGAEFVARAAPDGYALLFAGSGSHVTTFFITKSHPYHPVNDFTPITMAGTAVTCLIVSPSFPANTVNELVDFARKNPGKVNFASNGIGTVYHLAGELLRLLTGAQMVHVPYKGGAQIMPDLLSGQVQVAFASLISVAPQIKAGKVHLIAVLEQARYPGYPDVPTMAESIPDFVKPPSWLGFFGPANLSVPVLERLNAELVKTLNFAEVRAKLDANGFAVVANTPNQFAAAIRSDMDLTARLVKAAGIKPE